MIVTLKSEQVEDDNKQEYCQKQLDQAEDKMKAVAQQLDDAEIAIEEAKERISVLKDELKGLEKSIKELDKTVAEATEIRQSQHQEFSELIAQNTAAKELLVWAKNRLHKFYNPRLYKAPPKRELGDDVSVVDTPGGATAVFTQVSSHMFHKDEPATAP